MQGVRRDVPPLRRCRIAADSRRFLAVQALPGHECPSVQAASGTAAEGRKLIDVSTHPADHSDSHDELPVEELLRRARPLPSHEEMVIDDLSEDEGTAFLAAVKS